MSDFKPAYPSSPGAMYQRPDTVPFRGDPNYPLDPTLPRTQKPQLTVESITRVFDLSVDKDLSDYAGYMQEEAFGHLVIRQHEKQIIPEKNNWKILMVAWRFVEELPRDIVSRKNKLYSAPTQRSVLY